MTTPDLDLDLESLTRFIIKAKQSTFAGNGGNVPPTCPESHDLALSGDSWQYLDSFFGTRDFMGREVVYYLGKPVWGLIYFGRVVQPKTPKGELWAFLKASLLMTYAEGRFLGPSSHTDGRWRYEDDNVGDTSRFSGKEAIYLDDELVYELDYLGGLIH